MPTDTPSRTAVTLERIALAGLGVLFVALAWPQRWFNDDAFITFRYARNLAEGHGFVWNITDPVPVEGTTSLGWTLLSALVIALRQHPTIAAQLVGLAAGVAGLVLVRVAARRVDLPVGWALVPVLLLVAHRQYVLWSVSAMETVAAVVVALAATILLAREADADGTAPWRPVSGALFLLATLLRPEAPLLHAAAGAGVLAARPTRSALTRVGLSGAVHAAGLAALTAWRLGTFGQALPNPFYVKVGGFQWSRGATYLVEYLDQYHALLWILPLVAGVYTVLARRDVLGSALVAQAAAFVAWIVAIGGGRWEFRFVVPVLPAWAVLVAVGLRALAHARGRDRRAATRRWLAIGLAACVVVSQAATLYHPFRMFDTMMSRENLHRAALAMLIDGARLSEVLGPEDRIATGWAGAVPYLTRAWHFDPWGLNHPAARNWPFDRSGVLFHQRHATWEMLAAEDVQFVDIFNQFVYRRPLPPRALMPKVRPWASAGELVYCVELPGQREPWYWIFASPQPRRWVDDWLAAHGLRLVYAMPLPGPGRPGRGPGRAPDLLHREGR